MLAAPPVLSSSCALISDDETISSEIGRPFTTTQLLASTVGSGVVEEATVEVERLLPVIEIKPPEAAAEVPSAALVTLVIKVLLERKTRLDLAEAAGAKQGEIS